ncbi:MAG: type II toxin-antitoxin system HicA family toxin [Actinobacteria bacterium]|nr:MAG: type II toxin-antitoxin system HicA family toxin [Actinomycetota bacterium]
MKKVNWETIDIKELAILISAHLAKNNISAVLVGGACVSIYSNNKYLSMDLDYVSFATLKELKNAMEKIGFYQKSSRHFEHPNCRFFIEFPPGPIAIGQEMPIKEFKEIKTLTLLTPTDCVKDRLAAYFHWNDPQSLEQALMVAQAQPVDLDNVARWSKAEGASDKFFRFESLFKKGGK